ncbi:protein sel-1 homolog 3 [Myripristis murdjan]|uniref:protein sel-1 homolog 3 n=1 Tax=Myripristis murdjan TaxID=586833 RepID=UPI0011760431|nr:protein sel-1 homolog 3-like [Myripristis murdjan]
MSVLLANIFGYTFTAAVILMGQCVLQASSTSSSLSGKSPHGNFIWFDSASDKVIDGSAISVKYQCSRPCQLAVEAMISIPQGTEVVVFRRKWISSKPPRVPCTRLVLLRLPRAVKYQRDFFNRHIIEAQNVTIHAWLERLKDGYERRTYRGSLVRIHKVLRIVPLSASLTKPPTQCPSWPAELMWQLTRNKIYQCPHESETIDMLKFPLASTGEHFGVVRKFQPFINKNLERVRLHAVTRPSITLSVWIYLLKWCHRDLCGIIHHVDSQNLYDTLLMQLTDTGDVIIQARLTTGRDEAFRSHVALPLWKWIRLDCYIQDSKVMLDTTWDNETRRHTYEFQSSIHYEDTSGYFAIGGSRYLPGIHGYFGNVKYYRFGTEKVKNPLSPKTTLEDLDKTHLECQEIKRFTAAFLQGVTGSRITLNKGFCNPHFKPFRGQFKENICRQTWTWETQLKYSALFHFLQTKEEDLRAGSSSMNNLRHIRRSLFEQAVGQMFNMDLREIRLTSSKMALLQASSCLGNHQASLLLATIHLAGLGRSVDQQKGHVYSLIGALGDNRLALMHIGYKHTQGIDQFPKDFDMACSYYSNVGVQSIIDRGNMQEKQQYQPEHIYLSNKEDLNNMIHETSDAFYFLKYKAESGDTESQKNLGRILFWGQNGATKDMASGVKWLRRSAIQMKDPSAMYDYSVLLMKGHGVTKNTSLGLQLLKKAAAMGSVHALNGLGWYHSAILKDHKTAVKYFERAALNGSDDGMYNLGIYHLSGDNPDSPRRNETAAFQQFLNASSFGHVAASVEAAWYLSTGSLEGVSQDVERAVMLLKNTCEQNGHLGYMTRVALQAYLQGSWSDALMKYVLAAETGLGFAQINVAHLCEELNLGNDCHWRYYNYSTFNYDPHPSGLLKMGDYFYNSCSNQEDSLSLVGRAISMYSRAALAGSPQGMYNLVVLAQQGHVPPLSIQGLLNVSHQDELDILVEKMLQRCVEIEDEEAVTPCSLALLRVQMGKALRKMTHNSAQLLLVYASFIGFFIIIIIVPMQICLGQRNLSHHAVQLRTRMSAVNQTPVNWNRAQDGIMGRQGAVSRTHRVAEVLWLTIVNGEQWLRQTGDLAVTVSGVCLCAFWTTLLYHLL